MSLKNTIPIKENGWYDHMWWQFERQDHTIRYIQQVRFKQLKPHKEEAAFKQLEKQRKPFETNHDWEEYRREQKIYRTIRARSQVRPRSPPTPQELFPWYFEE